MDDLELICGAAVEAGKIAMSFFGNAPKNWDKGDGQGPVSEADLQIDGCMRRILSAARPDYGWLSEETDDDPVRLDHDTVFIVDPIDGTRAFLKGNENFSNCIAVAHKGQITAAVVHMPAKGRTYSAALGKGAFRDGVQLSPSVQGSATGATILASEPQFHNPAWRDGPPPAERHFRSSLAYRLCLVGEGRFDGMVTFQDSWEWDISAGDLICQEAGAVITDQTGRPLRYNSATATLNGVVAAGPAVHKSLFTYL